MGLRPQSGGQMSQSEADKKYRDAMKAKGFTSKRYWVHQDDADALKVYADKLRKKRDK